MEISSALPDLYLGLGNDEREGNDDDVDLGIGRPQIPRVSYDREKDDGDLASMDIYKPYLDEEDDEDEKHSTIPFNSEAVEPKLDRYK